MAYGIINSKVVLVTTNGTYTFLFPVTKFSYEIAKSTKENPSKISIEILGISSATFLEIHQASGDKYIEVYDGIDGQLNLTYSGVVEEVKFLFDKGNQRLSITANHASKKALFVNKTISIDSSNLNATLKVIGGQYGYNIIFPDGDDLSGVQCGKLCSTGSCVDAISSILPPMYSYSIDDKEICIYKDKTKLSGRFIVTLDFESGLLEYPLKEIDKSQDSTRVFYTIKTRYIPEIKEGVAIKIPKKSGWYASYDTGEYAEFIVRRYNMSFSDGYYDITYECDGIGGMID